MCPCGGLLEPCECGGDCCPDCGCATEAIWGPDYGDDDWDDNEDGCDDGDCEHAAGPRVVTVPAREEYL